MDKKQIEELVKQAKESIVVVEHAIKTLTADNPLILFDKESVNEEEDIDCLPFGFSVTQHDFYVEGVVWKIHGNEIVLFLRGEDWGELYHQEVSDLPFESQVDLLNLIGERM